MRLAVLCPSRGRPKMAKKMEASFPNEAFFYLDDDDSSLDKYDLKNVHVGKRTTILHATHILWQQNPGYDAYVLCGDDGVCRTSTIQEDIAAATAQFSDGIWVAGPADGRGDKSWPHPVVSRRWAEVLGYVVPPIFLHWYNDSRITALAQATGRFVPLPDVMIEHETPKTGKNPIDQTYKDIRSGLRHERDTHVASFQRYFDADLMELMKHL